MRRSGLVLIVSAIGCAVPERPHDSSVLDSSALVSSAHDTSALVSVAASAMLREALSLPHPPGVTRVYRAPTGDAKLDSSIAAFRNDLDLSLGSFQTLLDRWPERFQVSLDVPHFRKRIADSRADHGDIRETSSGLMMPDGSVRPLRHLERLCWDTVRRAPCTAADASADLWVDSIEVADGGRDVTVYYGFSVRTLPTARPGMARVGLGGAGYAHDLMHRYRREQGAWRLVEVRTLGMYN